MQDIKSKEIKLVPIEQIIDNPKNANRHSIEQIKRLEKLIAFQGFRNPLVISNRSGFLVVGHGRKLAAMNLGMTELPCIYQDFTDEAQEYAYLISDNEIARWAELDKHLVYTEMETLGLEDIELLGLEDFELPEIESLDPQTDEDEVPEVETPITRRGDIWLLGKHRLMCGDSTMIDDVEKLMNGEKADMVFTDPPYNIGYQDMNKEHDKIKNDKMSDEDFLQFLKDSIYAEASTYYVCCSWQYSHLFKQAMDDLGFKPKAMIVWNKVNPAQNLDKYFKAHEIIYYYGKFGGQKTLRSDVWEVKRQRNTVHPTMKPIELIDIAMEDQPDAKLIQDSFLGSGSTLISAEKNGRRCYGLEMEEKYCDVIINRWQNYTGKKATLEATSQTYEELQAERL